MALTEQNNISIAEIVIYTPALLIGIWLSVRHGFGRNAGWLYLIIFSLARIIGPAMELATINDPRNLSLYIGAATLRNVAVSPLILINVGLLSRALESIRKSTNTTQLNAHYLRLIQLVVLVGLILGSIGGSNSGHAYADTGAWTVNKLSTAAIGLMLAGFILTVIATALVATQVSQAEPGEKRLVLAVGLSLPFLLVRIAYSAEATFGSNPDFNLLTGNPNVQLGMAVIMEMIIVAIVEGVGLTLQKRPKAVQSAHGNAHPHERDHSRETAEGYQPAYSMEHV
ncbi:hypothetical protein F4778DRAFT_726208 [Xylariomycetidae sp. FL2044]|nr:hypothetical protein F4778DRAFT_726208 [Xylariomycetidae sp. FL2044]